MKRALHVLLSVLYALQVDPVEARMACPRLCSCADDMVDCSGRGLTVATLPSAFPPGAAELRLHSNRLTALPAGLLDGARDLRRVTLHDNPWACDCAVLYLRAWLLKQTDNALIKNVSCNSPPSLRGRLVVYLAEEEVLNSCRYWLCDLALASQISLFFFIVVQALLLAVIIHFLRRFNRLTCEVKASAAEGPAASASGVSEYTALKDGSY
ncbi:platelet glycoprotein Ib beta chain [Electrophorus electricus]|uniref:Glycoprotein Ib platelet subunit beta n=1 Tax=Electrophorus electricus TaxID=8005 RepID=A0A4W4FES2_ELEEL|nr:platelet glycoprotein Ib beta chain [Electrophorus electricus]